MPVIESVIESGVGWALGRVADQFTAVSMLRWKERAAKTELIEIIVQAMNAATDVVPSLGDDFRSETFVHGIVAPVVVQSLRDMNVKQPEAVIARAYIARFVEPFVRGRSPDETLSRLFRTEPRDLERAVAALLKCLRPALYGSKHWRDAIRDQTLEEIRSSVIGIKRQLGPLAITDEVDIDQARVDAQVASSALLSWSQSINGEHIDRFELEVLQQRIREQPNTCTLVIGESGSGKSALLSELAGRLQAQGMTALAIKADMLPNHVKTLADVSSALGMRSHVIGVIEALARVSPVVVLMDQLDAVSEVMDRSSERMSLLLQIVRHFQGRNRQERHAPPVHFLVSSRPFEADYDARFKSLNAEIVNLSLPSLEQVHELLGRLNVSPDEIPEALKETLRRPFALRLFVDVRRRGVPSRELIASQLLSTWLASADLGDSGLRRAVLQFLEKLAGDMTETESLWRPADVYEIAEPNAVQRAIASGVVVRQGNSVGFSHQAWLDDFQAKNFVSAQSLADFAWQRQDGLFARATVLRALQRLRAFDLPVYEQAINALLGQTQTRRHIRHLVVDMITGQQHPSARELAWLERIVRNDVPLARRALMHIATHWTDWRDHLLPLVPVMMTNADLRWVVVQLLIAEASSDGEFVTRSIAEHWGSPCGDFEALSVFSQAGLWSAEVVERLRLMFTRQRVEEHLIVSYAEVLGDERAVELFKTYLDHVEVRNETRLNFYGLMDIAKRLSADFAYVLFSWFVAVASRDAPVPRSVLYGYPTSSSLPNLWDCETTEGDIFGVTKSILLLCAKEHPQAFLKTIEGFIAVEVAEVQSMIAEGLAAASQSLAAEGVEYLLGDRRRFHVGTACLQDAEDVSHVVDGWSTRLLLIALVGHIDQSQIERIRVAIESWDPYPLEAWEESDVTLRRSRRSWSDDKRLALLSLLPAQHMLQPRRARQVQEWQSMQPKFRNEPGQLMGTLVGSPMSAEQMAKATDDDVFGMIDQIADDTDWGHGRRGLHRGGGAVQLAGAFAAFGKISPTRALGIAEQRFVPGRHEYAAGELIRALAEDPSIDSRRLCALIWKWHLEGFATTGWRRDAAWAMQTLARRDGGLDDKDVGLLESWIVNDPQRTKERVAARLSLEQRNREANRHLNARTAAVVFCRTSGGFRFLPQDNFVFLAAMAGGLMCRPQPNGDGWLSALERHAERSEDPAIWTALLMFHGRHLHSSNHVRAQQLLRTVSERFPEAFDKTDIAEFLWRSRDLVPDDVMAGVLDRWLTEGAPSTRQAAGELLMAMVLLNPEKSTAAEQLERILAGPEMPERLGAVFTAATAWNEDAIAFRPTVHDVLMRFAPHAKGPEASAVASALSNKPGLHPDAFTQELLSAVSNNSAVLEGCLARSFTRALQKLLLNPGFEELVLQVSERCTELVFAKGDSRMRMPYDGSFVSIAIALQRSMDPVRSRAMDLYERLLDGAAYGAEEAATASLVRFQILPSD